jgi:hypothetical protein
VPDFFDTSLFPLAQPATLLGRRRLPRRAAEQAADVLQLARNEAARLLLPGWLGNVASPTTGIAAAAAAAAAACSHEPSNGFAPRCLAEKQQQQQRRVLTVRPVSTPVALLAAV